MKIGIITIAYGENYGNRLQNYALQEILVSLGVKAETIKDISPHGWSLKKRIEIACREFISNIIKRKIIRYKRALSFSVFNKKYIKYSKIKFGYKSSYLSLNRTYDYFIIGSDQVWNTHFDDIRIKIYNMLAGFAEGNKRIAYAASFGQASIKKGCEQYFESELPLFKKISVREISGVELVKKCNAQAVVTLDPTMLINKDQWNRIERKPKMVPGGEYVVTYLFNQNDDRMKEYIRIVAGTKHIVNIFDIFVEQKNIDNPDIYSAAPDEFVWLISHASCVLTDSYHGAVFSIIFHKPFIVFDRLIDGQDGKMGGRIDTLLSTFGLESCRGDINNPTGLPVEPDWEKVDRILEKEREKSLQFLKNALDLESQNEQ
ncbi:MAG: polysaccharide pyruvyl transferase family protein [Parasporobacterium sp.]|nr:polysaccharide pyruvyl transferase family protein [Parasporobacterium sp.]